MSAGCREGKCSRVLGKGAGDFGVVWGLRRQPGEGRGAGDRHGRAAEAKCCGTAVPPRAALGSGTPQPAMLANKVSERRAVACSGHGSALTAAPCLPPFPRRALGVCVGILGSLLVWHQPRAGCWGRDEKNAISQRFASRWGRKLTFSLCGAPSVAQAHTELCSGGCWHPGTALPFLGSGGRLEREGVSIRDA